MDCKMDGSKKDLIVLVHGFAAKRLVMWPFACLLRARGFRVRFWSYGSLFDPIEKHAIRFYDYLHSVTATECQFHIVAHSMGCIVTHCDSQFTSSVDEGQQTHGKIFDSRLV